MHQANAGRSDPLAIVLTTAASAGRLGADIGDQQRSRRHKQQGPAVIAPFCLTSRSCGC
jgi:hypothetical protein